MTEKLALQEANAWFDLQRATVERVHASWLPTLAAELVVEARKTPTGRRWLANRLTAVVPILFALPCAAGSESAHELQELHKLHELHDPFKAALQDPLQRALDLGCHVLAARLRRVVTRSSVIRLRALLGVKRYERALQAAPAALERAVSERAVSRLCPQTGDEAELLAAEVLHRGAVELAAYAAQLHPALATSVKLSFERDWWRSPPPSTLRPETVAACLGLFAQDRCHAPLAPRPAARSHSEVMS